MKGYLASWEGMYSRRRQKRTCKVTWLVGKECTLEEDRKEQHGRILLQG